MMIGDSWDLNLILQWCDYFWVNEEEYEDEFRIEIAGAILDLAKCFNACIKAHLAAYDLNIRRKDLAVCINFLVIPYKFTNKS
jgi:hypothetical protein